jgi:hypothetical protein
MNHQIVPSMKDIYLAAPNFFLEVKGSNRSTAQGTMQACYDGGIGARGMHALQGYGTLKMYTYHPTQPSRLGESPQYHMTPFHQRNLIWAHLGFLRLRQFSLTVFSGFLGLRPQFQKNILISHLLQESLA